MDQASIEKLKNQIIKGGFPFELEVTKIFVEKKWQVDNNTYYLDKDEKKGREIDLIGKYTRNDLSNENYIEFTFGFITEIKKETEKPWIIFSTETDSIERGIHESFYTKIEANFDKKELVKLFRKYNKKLNKQLGRSFTEGFGQGRDKIFTSLCNVTKAYIHHLENVYKDKSTDEIMSYYEPLIVLNGALFEAIIDNNGELLLIEKDFIQIRFNYFSDFYKQKTYGYIINVVTKNYLSKYLDQRTEEFNQIYIDYIKNEL